jgi:hypothetical protein
MEAKLSFHVERGKWLARLPATAFSQKTQPARANRRRVYVGVYSR